MVISHSDTGRFILNTKSLHNYRHIKAAVPPVLLRPVFSVDDPGTLVSLAASQVREKKTKQAEMKKKALIDQLRKRAGRLAKNSATSSDLLHSLQTDDDLVELFEDALDVSTEEQRSGDVIEQRQQELDALREDVTAATATVASESATIAPTFHTHVRNTVSPTSVITL